ncbi:recombinase family protein [Singulisphaera sp. PoT]|uniref:recombinase family protein n=1 Tax=Singulisphaera sp. PoT TaxID=3411797 RepID=UPI003BF54B5F
MRRKRIFQQAVKCLTAPVNRSGTLYIREPANAPRRLPPCLNSPQGVSGLSFEAQEAAIAAYTQAHHGTIIQPYTEVETGKKADRPELVKALADCKRSRATLVIAKLDRLARNARFLLTLIESGVDVVFCDLPTVPSGAVGKFILTQMAPVAELEAGLTSERTKAALVAYKARGGLLGSARPGARRLTGGANSKAARRAGEVAKANAEDAYADLAPKLAEMRTGGLSLRQIARRLNQEGHTTRRGKVWNAMQVRRVFMLSLPAGLPE